ncbi:MAG TPA: M20/M25/M40 family metallo-hydrolase [Thermoanaerobaculia bacterium]|nr:M20/M25/M40 family metallo-hydrolase [Thermoanaerobaculia bacterium]
MAGRIREEAFSGSQAMAIVEHLTDRVGARLTGSPALLEANEWTRSQMEGWGLRNAHLEEWGPFGRGWSFSRASLHLTSPRRLPLFALPQAWTPGTKAAARGAAVRLELSTEEDLEQHRGKLAGKVLLFGEPQEITPGEQAYFRRRSSEDLDELERFPIPEERDRGRDPDFRRRMMHRARFQPLLNRFLEDEGVLAVLRPSGRNDAILRVGGSGSREPGESPGVTELVVAAEHYNLLTRLLDAGEEVELEVEVAARFHDDDRMAYNTIAEIPGTDLADQVVMVGAHLDSWHAGTGATDNAAGCAVAMEAVRILQALGVRPRRTIRVALWTGEEQGLLGSRAYVSEHFASRPPPEKEERNLPRFLRSERGPLTLEPEHAGLSAYFNLDNGSGRIRGVYTQSNAAVVPIFETWLRPFHDLGADRVTMRNTGGTDHLSFDRVGLPGFQFVQDPLDYSSRTHHTNLDVLDRVQRDDLIQASAIMASFVYHAAMRDELLPRKPLPPESRGEDEGSDQPSTPPTPAAAGSN